MQVGLRNENCGKKFNRLLNAIAMFVSTVLFVKSTMIVVASNNQALNATLNSNQQ